MLKYFAFLSYLLFLAWQVNGLAQLAGKDIDLSEFNETDEYDNQPEPVPEPRIIQVRVNRKSYTVVPVDVNWHTAREFCTSQNQVLASIQSYDDHLEVVQALMRYGIYNKDVTFWLGGSQLGHLGMWHWVSTGRPVTFSNWKSRPYSDSPCNRHCMEVGIDGGWNATDCNLRRGVICEDPQVCRNSYDY